MKILMIGDVSSCVGRDALFEYSERGFLGADIVIANVENAAHGRGVTRGVYAELERTGVHGYTLGNHIWDCSDINHIFRFNDNIIRPYNLEGDVPGNGCMILKSASGIRVGVISLIGRVNVTMPLSQNPFLAADRAIEKLRGRCDVIAVDFHAEATSEKRALGFYLDGKISALFGTHTHVQTADSQILKNGTGYITDLGMTGPANSCLGVKTEIIIDRLKNGGAARFEQADGRKMLNGCIFEIDRASGKAVGAERIYIEERN